MLVSILLNLVLRLKSVIFCLTLGIKLMLLLYMLQKSTVMRIIPLISKGIKTNLNLIILISRGFIKLSWIYVRGQSLCWPYTLHYIEKPSGASLGVSLRVILYCKHNTTLPAENILWLYKLENPEWTRV